MQNSPLCHEQVGRVDARQCCHRLVVSFCRHAAHRIKAAGQGLRGWRHSSWLPQTCGAAQQAVRATETPSSCSPSTARHTGPAAPSRELLHRLQSDVGGHVGHEARLQSKAVGGAAVRCRAQQVLWGREGGMSVWDAGTVTFAGQPAPMGCTGATQSLPPAKPRHQVLAHTCSSVPPGCSWEGGASWSAVNSRRS